VVAGPTDRAMHPGSNPEPMDDQNGTGEIFEEIERRALLSMDEEEADDAIDVVGALSGRPADEPALDLTLAGYIEKHDRVPAFEGADGQPYTVDVGVDETDDPDRPFAAFLVFVRWALTGAGIMDHTESGDLAFGSSDVDARNRIGELSLYEIKAELDAAIERKHRELQD
jgi:hypothetical protein